MLVRPPVIVVALLLAGCASPAPVESPPPAPPEPVPPPDAPVPVPNNPPRLTSTFLARTPVEATTEGAVTYFEAKNVVEQVPLTFEPDIGAMFADPDGDELRVEAEVRQVSDDGTVLYESTCTQDPCTFSGLKAGQTYTLVVGANDTRGATAIFAQEFVTRLPVVLIHGLKGGSFEWEAAAVQHLEREGFEVLDFSRVTRSGWEKRFEGNRVLDWSPTEDYPTIEEATAKFVGPAIRLALVENGFSEDQRFDIVSHSMGGLVSRMLLQNAGRASSEFEAAYKATCEKDPQNLYCDGVDWEIDPSWAGQVRSLVMIGTPNHGSNGSHLCGADASKDWDRAWIRSHEYWQDACREMLPGGAFTEVVLGFGTAPGVQYFTIGGDFFVDLATETPDGEDGEHDGIVTKTSPALPGVPHEIFRVCHNAADWSHVCGLKDSELGSEEVLAQVAAWLDS